jgi:predicted metal-binding protein
MIECKFSCGKCGATNVPFLVRARVEGEDVVWWTTHVFNNALKVAHASYNLLCEAQTIDEVMIPIPEGTPGIGMLPLVEKQN